MEYVAARFNRGSGLGNRLFPWARAALYARDHDCPLLAPFWPRWTTTGLVRGGLARENFLRQILLVGAFQTALDDVTGWNKLCVLARARTIAEEVAPVCEGGTYLRIFAGEGRQFGDINFRNRELLEAFTSGVPLRWRNLADRHRNFVIGINVRRGKDFRDAKNEEEYLTAGGLRTPLIWFVRALRYVRSILGQQAPALLVSDGTAADLAELLAERNIEILRPGCASSDLLALSRSKVLLGSGGSSFSAWASFFAQCPTITIRGQSLQWFSLDLGDAIYVGDFHPDAPPLLFCENLRRISRENHGSLLSDTLVVE